MQNRHILLGAGYASVQQEGFESILTQQQDSKNIPIIMPTPETESEYTYKARFIETTAELKRELSVALDASASIGNVNASLTGSYDNSRDNARYARYYLIELFAKQYRKYLNVKEAAEFGEVKQFLTADTTEELQSFYERYGDRFISQIVYGQKLVVVIQIKKELENKTRKWSVATKLSMPIGTTGGVLGGGVTVNSLLDIVNSDSISDIKIHAIGSNQPGVQTAIVADIGKLREILGGFVQPDSTNKSAAIPSTMPLTGTVAPVSQPALGSKPLEPPAAKSAADSKSADATNSFAPIAFETSSYRALIQLLPKDAQNAIEEKYKKLLEATSRARKFLEFISACHTRCHIYLEHIDYALNNSEAIHFNEVDEVRLQNRKTLLKEYLRKLKVAYNNITQHIFHPDKANFWAPTWNVIKQVADSLDALSDPFIQFQQSAFLVGTIKSHYYNRWNWRLRPRSSKFIKMQVPFEADKLYFEVTDQALVAPEPLAVSAVPEVPSVLVKTLPPEPEEQKPAPPRAPRRLHPGIENGTLVFDLYRQGEIAVTGRNGKKHRSLHKKLHNGSLVDHLFLDAVPLVERAAKKGKNVLPGDYIAFLSANYNYRVYKKIAIGYPKFTPTPRLCGNVPDCCACCFPVAPAVPAAPDRNATFFVSIYAKVGPTLDKLDFPNAPPRGEAQYDKYISLVKGDFAMADMQIERSRALLAKVLTAATEAQLPHQSHGAAMNAIMAYGLFPLVLSAQTGSQATSASHSLPTSSVSAGVSASSAAAGQLSDPEVPISFSVPLTVPRVVSASAPSASNVVHSSGSLAGTNATLFSHPSSSQSATHSSERISSSFDYDAPDDLSSLAKPQP